MARRLRSLIISSRSLTRHAPFLLLTILVSVAAYARGVVSPLQETIRMALHLSDNQMASLQGPALALPMIVIAIPLGLLIDRFSRVRLLLVFAIIDFMGNLLSAASPSFAVLFISRCIVGLAVTATNTTALALLGEWYAPMQRGRATMLIVVGQYAGNGAAFALGGALLASGIAAGDWRWVMTWLTVPIAVVVLSPISMREPLRTDVSITKTSGRESFREVWRYRATIAPLLAGMVLFEMAVCAVLTWSSPTFSRIFTLAPDRVGAIMMVTVSLGGIVGSIVGGILADLCQRTAGPRRTVVVASWLALASVPAALFGVLPGVALASAFLVAFMTIVCATMVMGLSLFTIVIPNELRGLCMAGIAAGQVLFGVGLAPLVVSMLSGALGGPAMIGRALAIFGVITCMLATAAFASGTHLLRPAQFPTGPVLAGAVDATDR